MMGAQLGESKTGPLRAGAVDQQYLRGTLGQPGGSATGKAATKTDIAGRENSKRSQHGGFPVSAKKTEINYTHYPAGCLFVAG